MRRGRIFSHSVSYVFNSGRWVCGLVLFGLRVWEPQPGRWVGWLCCPRVCPACAGAGMAPRGKRGWGGGWEVLGRVLLRLGLLNPWILLARLFMGSVSLLAHCNKSLSLSIFPFPHPEKGGFSYQTPPWLVKH